MDYYLSHGNQDSTLVVNLTQVYIKEEDEEGEE
jgi:hypothetical protein